MEKVVGIRFKSAGKVYYFDSGVFVLNIGDNVIVETEKGLALGTVAIAPFYLESGPDDKIKEHPLKKVHRLASEKDFSQLNLNADLEKNARTFCIKAIKDLGLEMNLFSVESSFDSSRLTFFFTSEGRIDFRELVKILVKELNVRVEMRQVGIRNQAKMSGGIGRCGRQICCSSFIEKFGPVSIRMAKEQGLSLNPAKISGQCGRLMCCLTFEDETYKTMSTRLPQVGKIIEYKSEKVKVIRHNPVLNKIIVKLPSGKEIEIDIGSKDLIIYENEEEGVF